MTYPHITLRYFAIQGRAQPIREFLLDAGVDFIDEQIEPPHESAAWQVKRERPELAGPFKALPVLHWGDQQVAETFAIVAFLARRVPRSTGDDRDWTWHDALLSCAFQDIGAILGQAIWADLAFPGCTAEAYLGVHGVRLFGKLAALDAAYCGGCFVFGTEPSLADHYAAHAFRGAAYIAPDPHALATRLPALAALARTLDRRLRGRHPDHTRPARLTACPIEPETVERLRRVDWLPPPADEPT